MNFVTSIAPPNPASAAQPMHPHHSIPYIVSRGLTGIATLGHVIAGLAAFSLTSCGTTEAPPRAIPAPIQSAAVSPLVDQAKADAAKGGEVSSRLEGKVESLQRTTGELRAGMSVATAEADRLRKQKVATEKELDALWQMLNGTEARAAALFAEVETAKKIADEQKAHRVIAEKRLDELAKAAIARDNETLELRDQRDHLAFELAQAAKVRAELSDKLSKAEQRAAVGTYLKGCIWVAAIAIFLALLFYILTKLRILP